MMMKLYVVENVYLNRTCGHELHYCGDIMINASL